MSNEPIIAIDLAMLIRDLITMGGRVAALEAEVKKFTSTNTARDEIFALLKRADKCLAGTVSHTARQCVQQAMQKLSPVA